MISSQVYAKHVFKDTYHHRFNSENALSTLDVPHISILMEVAASQEILQIACHIKLEGKSVLHVIAAIK